MDEPAVMLALAAVLVGVVSLLALLLATPPSGDSEGEASGASSAVKRVL